ncbi:TetR/AcrR family transcriptional regulator [Nocardia sp. NPDC057455]|uniref:TetR/AcrR family transcriptional regulator n=1 Tax=Nocardia sp. NPDC057455 TaxID=3346138 RepID=UPI00366FE70C
MRQCGGDARPDYDQRIGKSRKPNVEERRRVLCDAAIRVLADHGSKGLTHQKVDQYAAVPDGTTSYYYRTRAALLRAVAQRVADRDMENLRTVNGRSPESASPFTRLAELVMAQGHGVGLELNKARHELFLLSTRDPALAETFDGFVRRIIDMGRDAVITLQPGDDDALLDQQNVALTTFISGALLRMIAGDKSIQSVDHLDKLLQAVAHGVTMQHTAGDR